jgi:hypothetical protein
MKAVTLCAALFFAASLAQASAASCPSHGSEMARTELLFGAGQVGMAQWTTFLSREVTPRFPDGLTVLDGYGQWKARSGKISAERSRILLLWHPPGAEADSKIDAIRDAYKKRFHQLSVMRVDSVDCVAF